MYFDLNVRGYLNILTRKLMFNNLDPNLHTDFPSQLILG